ncbi:hypothetical protein PENSPDRAFT_653079 [Peniophora sp. CONT]|nr:hypothetical protein PENSPDRAFT_653079 [Peniophora sp. CONT]
MDIEARSAGDPWTQLASTRLAARKPGESPSTHQAQLSEDIRHLERVLLQAKELYNSDSPISSLPDEILTDIFSRMRDDAAEKALVADEQLPSPTWDESATICRRFRRIITQCPSLHTRLSTATHSATYIGHALARSESMPIELDILQPSRNAEEAGCLYDLLRQHGPQVDVLSLKFTENCVPLICSWLQSLSHMEKLSLEPIAYVQGDEVTFVGDEGLDIRLGPRFQPVRLSTLILSQVNFVVAHYNNLCSNLTTLSLKNLTVADGPRSQYLDILRVLRSANCLVTLAIHYVDLYQSSSTPIPLPGRLQDLEYFVEDQDHLDLLSRIVPAASVHLKLAQEDTSWQHADFCQIPSVKWMAAVGPPVHASLQIMKRKQPSFGDLRAQLDLWGACNDAKRQACLPDLSLRRSLDTDTNVDNLLLNHQNLDYSHLQTLEIRAIMRYDLFPHLSTGLDEMKLPSLRTLIVNYAPAQPENQHDRGKIYYLYVFLRGHFNRTGPLETLIASEYIATALQELGSTPQPPRAGQEGYADLIAYNNDSMPPLSFTDLVLNVSIIASD